MRDFPKAVFSDLKRCLCVDEKAKMHRKNYVFQNTHVAAEKAQVYCDHSPIAADMTASFTRRERMFVYIVPFISPPKTTATIENSLEKHVSDRKQYVSCSIH